MQSYYQNYSIHSPNNGVRVVTLTPLFFSSKRKKPAVRRVLLNGTWQCPTLTWGDPTLPSALSGFTAEFGMGSGGSRSLWSSGVTVNAYHAVFCVRLLPSRLIGSVHVSGYPSVFTLIVITATRPLGCYRVKPHGPLVHVSSTPCSASTPCLSTSWSRWAL